MTVNHELETQKKLILMRKKMWCHKILIPCCTTVLFLPIFFDFSSTAFKISLFLCTSVWRLTLAALDLMFKIEEFVPKMAISLKSGRVKRNNHSALANWPNRALSSQHLRRFLYIFSVHLCIPVSLPPFHFTFWSAFGFPRLPSFSQSTSLYLPYLSLLSKTQLKKAFSPNAGALLPWHSLLQWVYGMVRVPRNLDPALYHCCETLRWGSVKWLQPSWMT